MLKQFIKSAVTLILVTLIASTVFASGKMEVPLGEKVYLQADAVQTGGSYKWIAKKGRDIISTQTGTIFNYVFNAQGEYQVNLTVTDKSGAVKNTNVSILVGDRYSTPVNSNSDSSGALIDSPLKVGIDTLPMTNEKTVHIAGNEGRVVFDMATRPDILEYRIDRNVYVDSDGDGIANNDIDNADHSSYLLGGVWQTKYNASESNKIAAEVTVVNTQGQKAKTQVEIIFGSTPVKEGKVIALLDTLPLLNKDNKKIYIYGEKDTVAFYARRSQGDIVEYRFDKNIFVDSDGDGNPANDIDNRTDASFKSGDVWTTQYIKTDEQVIAQLIVVGMGGTGSRIQREIVFTNTPEVNYVETPSDEAEDIIKLVADKDFVQKGDPIIFTIEGLSQDLDNYIFDWDFNGDDEIDQTVEGGNTVSYIYDTASIKQVKVKVMDKDGNEANFNLDLLVKDITATKSDFDYEVDGLTVNFNNLSEVTQNLTSKILEYTWAFGDIDPDNYGTQKDKIGAQNPSYNYTSPGTYIVSLTVVDSDQVSDTKSVEIILDTPAGVVVEEGLSYTDPKIKKEGSIIGGIFKIILYIILIVITLTVLIILGLLAFLKVQHPDLVFEELIDELKIKLLGMMGVHEMIEPVVDVQQPVAEEVIPLEEVPEKPVEDLSKQDAPIPDWLKPHTDTPAEEVASKPDVIEGEVVDMPVDSQSVDETKQEIVAKPASTEGDPTEGEADLSKEDGPVPDWLK